MGIPISSIVEVVPRLISAGQTGLELNGLFLTKSERITTASRALEFTDVKSVYDYFGDDSEEARLASIYFAGYDNSSRKPARAYFALFISENLPAWIRGGKPAELPALQAVTAGALTLTVGGTQDTVTLDLSAATSYSGIAELIQTAVRAKSSAAAWQSAAVIYSSDFKAFILTSGTAGVEVGIDYAAGTLAEALGWTAAKGALLSQGADAETAAGNMESITAITDNFVSFTAIFTPTEAEHLAFAQWAASKGVRFLYVVWSETVPLTIPGNTENIGSLLQEAGYGATTAIYGSADYAAFILGFAASVNYNTTRGTATAAFKSNSALAINVKDSTTANALKEKGFNYYGRYTENSLAYTFLYPGSMFGSYGFIDTYINAVWLNASIQQAEITLLTNNPRVPYNELGYGLVKAAMQDVILQAIENGVIDTGVELSTAQKAQINQEAGKEIADSLWTDGYYAQVKDPGAAARGGRLSPEIGLWYTYGGAIQRIIINSTLVE
jgi:hypothetical protein